MPRQEKCFLFAFFQAASHTYPADTFVSTRELMHTNIKQAANYDTGSGKRRCQQQRCQRRQRQQECLTSATLANAMANLNATASVNTANESQVSTTEPRELRTLIAYRAGKAPSLCPPSTLAAFIHRSSRVKLFVRASKTKA